MAGLRDILNEALEEAREEIAAEDKSDGPIVAEVLRDTYAHIERTHNFKVGDLVKTKPNCCSFRYPQAHHPAVVLQVLDKPRIGHDKGSPYYVNDLLLACWSTKHKVIVPYLHDSRYFEPYEEGD